MTIEGYSNKELLQDVILKTYNPLVREWFSDLGDENWNPDIRQPRGAIRFACTHQDRDSCIMTNLRCQLFNLIREREAIAIAGIPMGHVHEMRKFQPQVMLYFQEDANDVEVGFTPVTGQIQFRIMDNDNITPVEAAALATRIKSEFALAGGYIWRKGRHSFTYTDTSQGYKIQLFIRDKAAGREIVNKVLDTRNHTPDWSKANYKESEDPASAYPTLPPTQVIYGESRRLPRRRPVADVRFQYAVLHIWGVPNPIALVDRSGVWPAPIERV